ncbi:hypothetical protein Dimus_031296 [Dionaea muscipula]
MVERAAAGSNLPPGFRFHPTDEELIIHYLKNQTMSIPCPVSIIPEVDIYKFDPWQLPEKAVFGEKEWYFFSPRDRKYPNGVRPNRATLSGYWKATGTDKAIYSGARYVGIKKALVFYQGRPPKGNKTDWIMHEYRLNSSRVQPVKPRGSSMRLDDWVLCRIYKKRHVGMRIPDQLKEEEEKYSQDDHESPPPPMAAMMITTTSTGVEVGVASTSSCTSQDDHHHQQQQQQVLKFPRTVSLAHLLDMDYLGPIAHLLNDSNPFDFHGGFEPNDSGEVPYLQYGDLIMNHQSFVSD